VRNFHIVGAETLKLLVGIINLYGHFYWNFYNFQLIKLGLICSSLEATDSFSNK